MIGILICISLFLGCVTSKDVESLSLDKTIFYPISENGKWGYSNQNGERVIEPIYDQVEFFNKGLGLVKSKGKYGYIKKNGNWHLKPMYDSGTNFNSNYAVVSIKRDTFYIDRKGKKKKKVKHFPREAGGCIITSAVNPEKYFFKVNEKYELEFKYYLVSDSSNTEKIVDTSEIKIDEIIAYGNSHILLKKDGKYGLFDIWSHRRIIIDKNDSSNYEKEAHSQLSNLIEFKYDDVIFKRFLENEVTYAKVRIKNKYGVIDSQGFLILDIKFDNLEIEHGWQMALVEYESNKFGYKKFNGKEFFKRKENYQ